ncbi:MAG: L,D-transpeptidase family protein, partial [Hyphomicrobiaceae bacterium]
MLKKNRSTGKPSRAKADLRASASRRAFLAGAAGAGTLVGTHRAWAQSWLESLQGFGYTPPRPRAAPRVVPEINDLRRDKIPWRSDEMLSMVAAAINRYERIVESGGWPPIRKGRMLRLDDEDERILAIKRRLAMSGELSAAPSYFSYARFDERLEDAVRRFQEQFGLRVTGRVDQPTLGQLAAPAAARLHQLRVNQRRIQTLMQGRMEDRYVLVNAAAYQLEAVEKYQVDRRHRVIVGKPNRQTPEVKATIRALNFFPYWHVPDSVANLDLIPRLRKEPEYLQQEHIRVYSTSGQELDPRDIDWNQVDAGKVRFKQDPGPWNALGLVRIDMPNAEIVFMHDTPMKPLFAQRVRPFSAGCVRVQDVFKLV